MARVIISLGDDFESANAAVMYHARDVVGGSKLEAGEQQKEDKALVTGDEQTKLWAENWYDGLSYCKFGSHILCSKADLSLRYMECTRTTAHRR